MAVRIGLLPPVGKGSVADKPVRPEAGEGIGEIERGGLAESDGQGDKEADAGVLAGQRIGPIADRVGHGRIGGG